MYFVQLRIAPQNPKTPSIIYVFKAQVIGHLLITKKKLLQYG